MKKYIAIFLISFLIFLPQLHASRFTLDTISASLVGQAPPVTLNQPAYTYTCLYLSRTSRAALTYQDFEGTSLPSNWASIGSTWSMIPGGGYKGGALQGTDNGGGIGGSTEFYWNTQVSFTSGSSYNITAKVKISAVPSNSIVYAGIAIIRNPTNMLYEISISSNNRFNIRLFSPSPTTLVFAQVTITLNTWYIIYVSITRTTTNIINAYLYDVNGNLLANISATNNNFNPNSGFFGVDVDTRGSATNNGVARFDDFLAGNGDLRFIRINNLQSGMQAQIIDNLGNLVASGSATTSNLALNVLSDVVVGTGTDGRIILKYPSGQNCLIYNNPTSNAILGGDTYTLITATMTIAIDSTKTLANNTFYISPSNANITQTIAIVISIVDSRTYYALLNLTSSSSLASGLYANITLSGSSNSTSIVITNSVVSTSITSEVSISGSNNYILISAYYTTAAKTSTLNLMLQYCTVANGNGACVLYPINLIIKS